MKAEVIGHMSQNTATYKDQENWLLKLPSVRSSLQPLASKSSYISAELIKACKV